MCKSEVKEMIHEYLNREESEYVTVFDLASKEFDVRESMAVYGLQAEDKVLVLPYREALYPYNLAMSEFLGKNDNIVVPIRQSATQYLRKISCYYDFLEYWEAKCEKALAIWLQELEIIEQAKKVS